MQLTTPMTMLRPAVTQLLKTGESYYSLVIAVAKRAREITNEAYENKIVMDTKAVKTAVEQFATGEYKMLESPELRK